MEKYQPSNGTEGMAFYDEYCMQCRHCDPDPEGEKQCDILLRSMAYSINDEEYPEEWQRDENGNGLCTKFSRWNWEIQGNPDDPDNPNYMIPVAPNQLKLFPK